MTLVPLDLSEIKRTVQLPDSWNTLLKAGFHPDLVDRAYAHLGWITRLEEHVALGNARAILASLAKGFVTPFKRDMFEPRGDDPHAKMKRRALDALDELSAFFGGRVSTVVWNSFAHLATRSNPEESRSILKEADALPHHFGIVDTVLHASGKVYSFMMHVQSVFWKHTGMILNHNCDCNCSLINLMPIGGTVEARLSPDTLLEPTQSLFTHILAESHLILDEKLPFEYTITGEALLLLRQQGAAI